ncbi:MAG TPA: DEAD/DEAH box helicase [Gemmatimonadota bacterium]|nr:DEAD/DEAH box helicase [Gemmatimonadota bacterium]
MKKNGSRDSARSNDNGDGNRSGDGNAHPGFHGLGLDSRLLRTIEDLGFERPTPVQIEAIPPALDGRDILACAMTGSGKTAAFVLPILQRLLDEPRKGTRVLILTPTRELAAQVADHFAELAAHTNVRVATVFGGVGAGAQESAFRKGVEVIVGTPGRLLDHFQHDYARLSRLEVLVFDEADRMLDMGFLPDIKRILRHLPKAPRQTLFFSATMPEEIVRLSRDILREPVRISVERKSAPATGVVQALYPIGAQLKVQLLGELLERGEIGNAIVFCRTKHRADRLAKKLVARGIAAGRIHGNRSQGQRTAALAAFKNGHTRVLVATDIVARGIDVEALDHVVNFDVPHTPDDYIHRVGRTARAEMTGDAYTLVSPEEEGTIRAIERALGGAIERRTVEGFDYRGPAEPRLEAPGRDRAPRHRHAGRAPGRLSPR